MSLIGKKPFVQDIFANLTKENLESLQGLVDNLGTPTLVALYGPDNLIGNGNKGVSYVTFKLDELTNKTVSGFLCYKDDDHCGLFAFQDGFQEMQSIRIDPVDRKYYVYQEHLTAEEFRRAIDDFLENKGGGGGAVESVNGQTGTVVLKAENIKSTNNKTIQENLDNVIPDNLVGSDYISVDEGEQTGKYVVELDQTKLDHEPVENSDNLITSGAVYNAVSGIGSVQLTSVLDDDITIDNNTITVPTGYMTADGYYKAILEIETGGTHTSASFDLCPFNDDVCIALGYVNIGGDTNIEIHAAIQEDGSVTFQVIGTNLATTDKAIVKYLKYSVE